MFVTRLIFTVVQCTVRKIVIWNVCHEPNLDGKVKSKHTSFFLQCRHFLSHYQNRSNCPHLVLFTTSAAHLNFPMCHHSLLDSMKFSHKLSHSTVTMETTRKPLLLPNVYVTSICFAKQSSSGSGRRTMVAVVAATSHPTGSRKESYDCGKTRFRHINLPADLYYAGTWLRWPVHRRRP